MMQGDSYHIPITIKRSDGSLVSDKDVLDVEVVLGNLTKKASSGQLHYEEGQWLFPLTQEETFGFATVVNAQMRIKWPNGEVEGCNLGKINVSYSRSKEVL